MKTLRLKLNNNKLSKLKVVKFVKELSGLDLKDSKNLIDKLENCHDVDALEYVEIKTINNTYSVEYIRNEFSEMGIDISTNSDIRIKKLKKILYSDKKSLISDMLKDMSNWENFVDKSDLDAYTYTDCKDIATKNILEHYHDYIESDLFFNIFDDINRINQLEQKDIAYKFIKFNEEFGEFCAEYLKYKGFTYKPYNKDELLGEMADSLQVLLSIYGQTFEETGITLTDVLEKIIEKNKKWENKIKEYTKFN